MDENYIEKLEKLEKLKNQSGKVWRDYKTVTAAMNIIRSNWGGNEEKGYNPDKTMQENFVDFINKNGCKVVSVNKDYSSDMDSYTVENPSGMKFDCYLEKVPNNNDPLATISYGLKISEKKIVDNMKKYKTTYDADFKKYTDYRYRPSAERKQTQNSSGPTGPSLGSDGKKEQTLTPEEKKIENREYQKYLEKLIADHPYDDKSDS